VVHGRALGNALCRIAGDDVFVQFRQQVARNKP
jgi:hypothetical protein